MKNYKMYVKKPRRRSHWLIAIVVAVLLFIGASYGLRAWYNRNLAAVSSSSQIVYFPVVKGSTVHEIALDLKRANLIRSTRAFETYVRGKSLFSSLQAGTYALSPSMSTPQIVDKMVEGEVAKNLVTILPGKTLNQIRQGLKEAGYTDEELDKALDPATYPDIPLLEELPPGATLEGFLYPDSFQKEADTPVETIVRQSIEEMQEHMTDEIIAGFKNRGLSPYQGVTLASIVYQESGSAKDQPTVAQVFLTRLKQGMMLGSDVTAFYAADQAGLGKTLGVDSPYNTRIHSGLPPGPIGNMVDTALKAVAHPSKTDYLYFVAGDDGTIHFSHTQAEHEAAIAKYCHKECSQ